MTQQFAKRFTEHQPEQIAALRIELLKHPHIIAHAQAMGMTPKDAVQHTIEAWRDGTIEPHHDAEGHILGFR